MRREYKNSIWAFALSLFGIDLMVLLIYYLAVFSLADLMKGDAWEWIVTGISTLILWGMLWMRASARGKKDVDIDALHEKRMAQNPNFSAPPQYVSWHGFAAGLMARIPIIIVWFVHLFAKNKTVTEVIMRLYFGVHYKAILVFGTHPLAVVSYIILFSVVCGLAYMTGPAQRQKVLTIIKRNQAKKPK